MISFKRQPLGPTDRRLAINYAITL